MLVDAVILAGRANAGLLKGVRPEIEWEAMIEIAGRPMSSYVASVLADSTGVERVVVVGPAELASVLGSPFVIIPPGDSLPDNLRRGFAALGGGVSRPVLVAAADIPLVEAGMIEGFLAAAEELKADVHYPIVERRACEARFPEARRTYVRLREGAFTGGNFFLIGPGAIEPLSGLVERFYAARKSPLRLARLLGVGTIMRFLGKRLGIGDIEKTFTRLTGLIGRAVVVSHPEIGMDVDKPEDLVLAERELNQRRA